MNETMIDRWIPDGAERITPRVSPSAEEVVARMRVLRFQRPERPPRALGIAIALQVKDIAPHGRFRVADTRGGAIGTIADGAAIERFGAWWRRAVGATPDSPRAVITPALGWCLWRRGLAASLVRESPRLGRRPLQSEREFWAMRRIAQKLGARFLRARTSRSGNIKEMPAWILASGRDLARLAALSPRFLRWLYTTDAQILEGRRIDWQRVRIAERDYRAALDVEGALTEHRIPMRSWIPTIVKAVKNALRGRRAHEILPAIAEIAKQRGLSQWLSPQDARVLGVCPRDYYPGLTRAEGAGAMAAGIRPDERLGWLAGDPEYRGICLRADAEGEVSAWACAVARDPERYEALVRERDIPAPGGQMVRARLGARIGEITAADIGPQGVRAGVEGVFQRAAERLRLVREAKIRSAPVVPLAARPTWLPPLGAGWRRLNSESDLLREGDEMGHCVGHYGALVSSGSHVIIAIADVHGRSTLSLGPPHRGSGPVVHEHRGPANSDAPAAHVASVAAWIGGVA